MVDKGDSRDLALAEIAKRQHGSVTTRQLLAIGLGRSAIAARTESGRLHRVHQGVYAVGHLALGNEGRWMAAVLAGRTGAVLSHGAAAGALGVPASPRNPSTSPCR